MRGLLILGGLGAALYFANRRGYLPQLDGVIDAVEARVANILPMDQWGDPAIAKAEYVAQVQAATGGRPMPILGPDETVSLNPYEAMLRTHNRYLSGWAKANIGWAAAICKVENSGRDPTISGDSSTSHGVLQVKVATAETCYRVGYTLFAPTRENLLTYEGGIYFGTAEMERLAGLGHDLDWTIAAYNGGQGWEVKGDSYKAARLAYVKKVKRAFAALYGSVSA